MSHAARSGRNHPSPIDPALQNRLITNFGAPCLPNEMELLLAIKPLCRHIPGKSIDGKISTMSATEYQIVLHLWPTVAEIATRLQKSERQVRRILANLEQKGFLTRKALHDGRQRANRYDITPFLQRIADMIENKTEPATSLDESTHSQAKEAHRD